MAISELKGKKVNVKLWVPIQEVESSALDQLRNVASLPWAHTVCAMADVHAGSGATVGSVIALDGAVAPMAVGVDPGCGMIAVPINIEPERLKKRADKLLDAIEAYIPLGFEAHESPILKEQSAALRKDAELVLQEFQSLHPALREYEGLAARQLGTLGGGNHFIEVTEDSEGNAWIMLHSGSRRAGKEIADAHFKRAHGLDHNTELPDRALSVFLEGTPDFEAYLNDLFWAQNYARVNRAIMLERVFEAIRATFPSTEATADYISCHHNYVAKEVHGKVLYVTRKGAIRAGIGEMGIIPGAMSRNSYIVRGKGNEESLMSAPHGAGRKMSRSQAKKRFTQSDIEEQTDGTACRKDRSIIDELPGAYKPIDKVMEYSADLVDIVAELQPAIVCVKAYSKHGEKVGE